MNTHTTSPLFTDKLQRLSTLSRDGYYNPYTRFDWPDVLPEDKLWMSEELLTVHGTRFMAELDRAQLCALSKWESINFYSLNIHGIRELLVETTQRIHMPGYEGISEFLHHFIGEENEHMWFFAEFCYRYGGKLYPDKSIKLTEDSTDPTIQDFVVFARILIFEDIVDHYNYCMGKDQSLAPIIRQINGVHHQDESRHIAFGRQILENLHRELRERCTAQQLADLESYIKRYIVASVHSLYNPSVYRDAGIEEPYKLRNELLSEPSRKQSHEQLMARLIGFFSKTGIFSSPEVFTDE